MGRARVHFTVRVCVRVCAPAVPSLSLAARLPAPASISARSLFSVQTNTIENITHAYMNTLYQQSFLGSGQSPASPCPPAIRWATASRISFAASALASLDTSSCVGVSVGVGVGVSGNGGSNGGIGSGSGGTGTVTVRGTGTGHGLSCGDRGDGGGSQRQRRRRRWRRRRRRRWRRRWRRWRRRGWWESVGGVGGVGGSDGFPRR